jgi:hypothetical protein
MKTKVKLTKLALIVVTLFLFSACCILFPRAQRCPAKPKVFPTSLDFGLNQNVMMFSIKNDGGGTLDWQATKDASWLSLSRSSGSITDETQQVEVSVDRSLMANGTNNGEINVMTTEQTFKVNVIAEKKPPPPGLKISFSTMYIIDDEEIGEGDWRIRIKINGEQVVYIPSKEAGTGESVPINKTFNTDASDSRIEIFCKVHEQDGSEWEYVGEDTHVYVRSGESWPSGTFGAKKFKLKNDEGDVELRYNVSPL